MNNLKKLFSIIVLATAVLALSGFCQPPTLNFNHKLHASEYEIECSSCHGKTQETLLPKMSACADCHDAVSATEGSPACYQCHTDKAYKVRWTWQCLSPVWINLRKTFPHEKHTAMQPNCLACHTKIMSSTTSSDNNYPSSPHQ